MAKSTAVPKGYNTVTTYVTVRGALDVLDFIKKAFDAQITERHMNDDGTLMHAEAKIGDTVIMFGEASLRWHAMPAMFYVYVPNCDAAYKKAIGAGARSVREPADQHYGDRSGGVKDSAGNQWWVATRIAQAPKTKKKKKSKAAAKPKKAKAAKKPVKKASKAKKSRKAKKK